MKENSKPELSRCLSSGDTSKKRSVCERFAPANCRDFLCCQAKKVIYGIALLMLIFLSITSVIHSSDGYVVSVNSAERILYGGLAGIAAISLCWLLAYFLEKMPRIFKWTGALLLFGIAMYFSAWWIVNSANLPQGDAKSVYDIAYRAKEHDLLPIAPTGSYMSLWPFQSGLVMFFETIFRLAPNGDEMTIQWVYIPLLGLSLVSGYMVVKKMFSFTRTRIFWCILMSLYFPYYMHVNNMYGEIPSMALMLFALWMLLDYLDGHRAFRLIFMWLGLAGAVAVRKNTVIFASACVLVLAVMMLSNRKRRYFLVLALLTAAVAGG